MKIQPLWQSLKALNRKAARKLLARPALRSREEIGRLRNQQFALHWRLRNFGLKPVVMDFQEFARNCWFGPLDLTGMRLVQGDLGLRGKRIDRVTQDVFSTALSAARERHKAANWLWEGPERHSDTSEDT